MLNYETEKEVSQLLASYGGGSLSVSGIVWACMAHNLKVLDIGRSPVTGIVWVSVQHCTGGLVCIVDEQGLVSED